jgi:hypothetical protein
MLVKDYHAAVRRRFHIDTNVSETVRVGCLENNNIPRYWALGKHHVLYKLKVLSRQWANVRVITVKKTFSAASSTKTLKRRKPPHVLDILAI